MKAGLPLRNLKIVLFSRRPEVKDKALEPLMELFQELKERYRDQEEAEKEEPVEEQVTTPCRYDTQRYLAKWEVALMMPCSQWALSQNQ